jgi:uncharacterized tellurite resistance protein B-like protein
MLKALTAFFDQGFGSDSAGSAGTREQELEIATAVLLVEVARADFSEDEVEIEAVGDLLSAYLGLAREDVATLIDEAQRQADHAASLQAFTRQLHEELSQEEKHRIVELLWRVALADETLDKHEDHLIRKVAGLLYISHRDLIRIRNRVTGH